MSDQFSLFDQAAAEPHVPAAARLYELRGPSGEIYRFPPPRMMTPDQVARANEHWKSVGSWRIKPVPLRMSPT